MKARGHRRQRTAENASTANVRRMVKNPWNAKDRDVDLRARRMNKALTRNRLGSFGRRRNRRVLTDSGREGNDPAHDDGIPHFRDYLQLARIAGWSRLVLKSQDRNQTPACGQTRIWFHGAHLAALQHADPIEGRLRPDRSRATCASMSAARPSTTTPISAMRARSSSSTCCSACCATSMARLPSRMSATSPTSTTRSTRAPSSAASPIRELTEETTRRRSTRTSARSAC